MTREDAGDEGGRLSVLRGAPPSSLRFAARRDTPLRPPFISVKTNLGGIIPGITPAVESDGRRMSPCPSTFVCDGGRMRKGSVRL